MTGGAYSLGEFIFDFITGRRGCTIAQRREYSGDDWSYFIWTILKNLKNYKLQCSQLYGYKKDTGEVRYNECGFGTGILSCLQSGELPDLSDSYDGDHAVDEKYSQREKMLRDNFDDGLGVIFIDMSDLIMPFFVM